METFLALISSLLLIEPLKLIKQGIYMLRLILYIIVSIKIYKLIFSDFTIIYDFKYIIEFVMSGKIVFPILIFILTIILLEYVINFIYEISIYYFIEKKVDKKINEIKIDIGNNDNSKLILKRMISIYFIQKIKWKLVKDNYEKKIIKIDCNKLDTIGEIIIKLSILMLCIFNFYLIIISTTIILIALLIFIRKYLYYMICLYKNIFNDNINTI